MRQKWPLKKYKTGTEYRALFINSIRITLATRNIHRKNLCRSARNFCSISSGGPARQQEKYRSLIYRQICLMNHQKIHQTTLGNLTPRTSLDAPLDPLGPLNIPIDPLGPSRSPVLHYKSSEDLSNVAVDPIITLDVCLYPLVPPYYHQLHLADLT